MRVPTPSQASLTQFCDNNKNKTGKRTYSWQRGVFESLHSGVCQMVIQLAVRPTILNLMVKFYVSFTVHFVILFVNSQLDAQFFFM